MEIRLFGGGERQKACAARLDGTELGCEQLLLLPIPTTKDKKYITGTPTPLAAIPPLCTLGTLVAGYEIPPEIIREITARGGEVFDAGHDEEFLLANADLTARGALGFLLTNTQSDLTDMSIGIIGYGRIGSKLHRLLLFLGARVRVYTCRKSVAAELNAAGAECEIVCPTSDLSALDVVFNTSPEAIILPEIIEALPDKTRIIDLASGNIFAPSPRLTKLSSIPAAMYPISAGRLYAESIISGRRRVT